MQCENRKHNTGLLGGYLTNKEKLHIYKQNNHCDVKILWMGV